jgi:sugar/nucleoside kinase (ribokinase family)
VVCGSCVVDLPCLTVDLDSPLGADQIHSIEPITPIGGGITCNTGIALSRLGITTRVLSYVGDDLWGQILRSTFEAEGIATAQLAVHPTDPTTSVMVAIDSRGRRSFLVPSIKTATKSIDAAFIKQALPTIGQARYVVLGYFGRMPALEPDLEEVLRAIRATGCQTVMDTAGSGGDPERLFQVLPHLDVYIPSEIEARAQTRETDPRRIVDRFRQANPWALLGVKLGARGALLSDPQEGWIEVPACAPPGPVIDTTGAGDCFLAGFLAARLQGQCVREATRWASAAGAWSVAARGGYPGIPGKDRFLAYLQETAASAD